MTWDVAGTTNPPIRAEAVQISLSLDGGISFPITLAQSTPNDGTEEVSLPEARTMQARIRVAAIQNIFFDINGADLTLSQEQVKITMIERELNLVRIIWTSTPGLRYRIQERTHLGGGSWLDRAEMEGQVGATTFAVIEAQGTGRFFRVVQN